jgi:phosphate transport system substrate-binding protein
MLSKILFITIIWCKKEMEQKSFNYIILAVLVVGMGGTIAMQSIILMNVVEYPATIRVAGSTTCYPVIAEAAPDFMAINREYDVQLSAGGSSTGEARLAEGTADIGMTSKNLADRYASGWIDHVFGLDGVAIILNDNTLGDVEWMTMDAIYTIYNGTWTDWSELTWNDDFGAEGVSNPGYSGAIEIFTRESGSGTLDCFESTIKYNYSDGLLKLDADDPRSGYELSATQATFSTRNGNPQMADSVGSTDYAIGFCGMAYVEDTHVLVGVNATDGGPGSTWDDAVKATPSNVEKGLYPCSRELHLWTLPNPSLPVKKFISYVLSAYGQDIVENVGYVAIPQHNNGTADYDPVNENAVLDPYFGV